MRQVLEKHFPKVLELIRSSMKAPTIRYRYQRRRGSLDVKSGFAAGESADDRQLIDRLIASYASRSENPSGQWSEIFLERHADIRSAFAGNHRTRIEQILRDPATSDIFYGFDSTARSLRAGGMRIEDRHAPALALDALIALGEALGVQKVELPENYYFWRIDRIEPDAMLDLIDRKLGFKVPIPNPFPAEYGAITSRGIMSYRVPQALYQAWRISQLVEGIEKPRVLEIGGGLGRTAFYARQFGIDDYTIVDIPISSLAQGYFLGRVLGQENVALLGETLRADATKLISSGAFLRGSENYDLIVNIDSLTEIGRAAAQEYWRAISARSRTFLSINHEANEFTVRELIAGGAYPRISRSRYWLRRGFVEEVVHFA